MGSPVWLTKVVVEINTRQKRKTKPAYSELARELAIATCVLARIQRQTEAWNAFCLNNKKTSRVPEMEAVCVGRLAKGYVKIGASIVID